MSQSVLMSVAELSELLGVPVGSLRMWRQRGEGPRSFKLVGRVMYDRAEVMAWIEKAKEETSAGYVPEPAA